MTEEQDVFQVEKAFEQLEQMMEHLESDTISLREAIELYGQGAKLLSQCREELDGIEKEMMIIGEKMEQGENADEV